MTIVVAMKVTDGIVLAADSAVTLISYKVYDNLNKIFNLTRGKSIGALVYRWGRTGSASVETLSKNLRALLRRAGRGTKDDPDF